MCGIIGILLADEEGFVREEIESFFVALVDTSLTFFFTVGQSNDL
jgi:hypothetical protein